MDADDQESIKVIIETPKPWFVFAYKPKRDFSFLLVPFHGRDGAKQADWLSTGGVAMHGPV